MYYINKIYLRVNWNHTCHCIVSIGFKSLKSQCQVVSQLSVNWTTWKELWVKACFQPWRSPAWQNEILAKNIYNRLIRCCFFVVLRCFYLQIYLFSYVAFSLYFIAFHRISSHFIAFHRISSHFIWIPGLRSIRINSDIWKPTKSYENQVC